MASFHLPLRSYEMLWLFMCCLSTISTGQHCSSVSTGGKLIYAHLLIRKQWAPAPGSLACSRRLDRGDNANRCIFPALLFRTALHSLDAWNRLLWVSRITFRVTTGSRAFKITSYRNNTKSGYRENIILLLGQYFTDSVRLLLQSRKEQVKFP